jgi:Putative beta-barrel porin-2, OmpL-like. bbp2
MTRVQLSWSRRLMLVAAALVAMGGVAGAQTPAPAPAPTPEATPAPEPPKIDVTGFVDVYYGYNFNKVDPSLRTFDVQHNTFSLSLAEIAFAKAVTPESRAGFRVDLDFGKAADLVGAYEPGSNGQEIYKHVQQAYVSLLTGKVQWDAGKFVTPMGAEVIESQDNWNYTRSILFGYAIPFYHTGVRATITASPKVSLTGFLLNGWNNTSEINGNKTFALNATLKPSGSVTWYLNYMVGKETAGSDENRNLFDTTLSLTVSPTFSVMGNFDYGKEGDVKWWGLAAYAKLQANPNWALVARYEYLDDSEGGFMFIGTKGQTFTLTSDHLIAGGLKARLEYRTDFADDPIFSKNDGSSKKSQTTLTVGLVYGFGGKI